MKYINICKDCKTKDIRVENGQYFMVLNILWEKFGVGEDLLCLDCFENRLGRYLVKGEVTDCPVNRLNPLLCRLVTDNLWPDGEIVSKEERFARTGQNPDGSLKPETIDKILKLARK